MKISLEVTTTTTKEVDVDFTFPVYLKKDNKYYCFFDPAYLNRCIEVEDYSISKGVYYSTGLTDLKKTVVEKGAVSIGKEVFQNKLVEMLKIINGAMDEMHKTDEQ